MKTVLHQSHTRGHADHGWLNTHHSFSFANYYDPERIQFGALRVLNDDWIAAGEGFGKHPHDNMEIITIPLSGDVEHKDSMGHHGIIKTGEIQVMSAGTGIFHSEFNPNKNKATELLQIWVFPNKRNVSPRYDQISLEKIMKPDVLYQILSPEPDDQGVWIHQNAWFHMGDLSQGWAGKYELKKTGNGVYFFVIEGEVSISGQTLSRRDGMGVSEVNEIEIRANHPTKLLVIEIPM